MAERTYTLHEIEELTGIDRRTISYYVQQGLLPKVGRRGPRTRYSQPFLNRLQFVRMIRDLQDQGAMGSMTLSDIRELFRSTPDETIAEVVGGRKSLDAVDGGAQPQPSFITSTDNDTRTVVEIIEALRQDIAEVSSAAVLESKGRPLDPAQESSPSVDPDETFAERAYVALPASPQTPEERETPSGEYHRLTLEAIEEVPGAPVPERMTSPSLPIDAELREALARLHGVVKRQPRAYLRTTETWTRARVTEELNLAVRGLEERHLPLLERVAQILRRLMRDDEGGI